MSQVPPLLVAPSPRRHDLDALRAVAMLLGIGLHAGLSFMPGIWPVQDNHQFAPFGLFFSAIHGFRMPLFFLISGFFTAMLWRRRGLKALLTHRFKRIFLPCMLGLVTVMPLMWLAILWPSDNRAGSAQTAKASPGSADLWMAAVTGDITAIEGRLSGGADVNAPHPEWGTTPLALAALYDQTRAVELLLDKGADVNRKSRDGGTALHAAAFFGRAASVKLLLDRGADMTLRNQSGQTARETMTADWPTTKFIAGILKLNIERKAVEAGRAAAELEFLARGAESLAVKAARPASGDKKEGLLALLIMLPVFGHLWFLWFLCWLVVVFALYAVVAKGRNWRGLPSGLILSPARMLWLIPLTLIPQWFMGELIPVFGPDTSIGLLPMPHVLGYYAVFFGFGALYYDAQDDTGRVGRSWAMVLPLTLLVVFPLGLEFTTGTLGFRDRLLDAGWHRPVGHVLQVTYAWGMSFAFMGLFRRLMSGESRAMRYVSDSSYWLYVTHLPLIIGAQRLVRNWELPSLVKFTLICVAVTGFLLVLYQFMVRYTWIGKMLNGPRQRPEPPRPALGQLPTT